MDFESYKSNLSEEQEELLAAVESGTLRKVQNLVYQYENFKQEESLSYILLVMALRRNHKSISKFLIKEGCTTRTSFKTGIFNTPLYYAAEMDDIEIFKALWRRGASIFDKDANSETTLRMALLHESALYVLDFLLDDICYPKKFDSLDPNSENDMALFHAACLIDHTTAIETFLSRGFCVNTRSILSMDEWGGFTALHFSIKGRYSMSTQAVDLLLKVKDCDFYAVDDRGWTPAHLAFRQGYGRDLGFDVMTELMNLTIANGSMNPMDAHGLSHFHIACGITFKEQNVQSHVKLIKHFIDSNVDINSSISVEDKNYPGFTALHFAAERSSWEPLKLLLRNGADPTKTDKKVRTSLHLVCTNQVSKDENRLEIIKLLLHHGADHAAKDENHRTPLHCAFSEYCKASSDGHLLGGIEKLLLLSNKEGINHTDINGLSYLHIACSYNDSEIVENLVNNGASINSCIKNNSFSRSGYTPLLFAVSNKQIKIIEFLLKYGADANNADSCNNTPLYLACQHQVCELDELNKNSNNCGEINWLPSRTIHIRIIELLIEYGAISDVRNLYGSTPILNNCLTVDLTNDIRFSKNEKLLAEIRDETFIRQVKVMNILLDHGANVNTCCDFDGSVMHVLVKFHLMCPLNVE